MGERNGIHVLNYKSAEAEASVVLKIHHCLGDCISLMSLFLDATRKISQPDSMPTIPVINRSRGSKLPLCNVSGILKATWGVIFSVWCTVVDLVLSLATFLWMKDNKILRAPPGVIHHPNALAHVTVDLKDIAIVKKAIDGTVNYVISGMLWAGFVRYFDRLHAKDGSSSKEASDLRLWALVPVNIRPSPGLHGEERRFELLLPKKSDICRIMYTSGTTGEPKGVLITNENIVSIVTGIGYFLKSQNEEDVKLLVEDIVELKPTVFCGVPRVFDRIYSGPICKSIVSN